MIFEDKIITHFDSILIKYKLRSDLKEVLCADDHFILTNIGLPNKILDFEFVDEINFLSEFNILIAKINYDQNIVLNLKSGNILRDNDDCFLAESLRNFVFQLYTYDHLWGLTIPEAKSGNYRENRNHKKYASILQNELLKIDPELFEKDTHYFWGSLVEDIDFGIVG